MTKKIKPALLDNVSSSRIWRVAITTNNGHWARLDFSDRSAAELEYNRIRSASIFAQSWIHTITLEAVDD
jgi:hypothetical protein